MALPKGYTLDKPSSLPEGYTLDAPPEDASQNTTQDFSAPKDNKEGTYKMALGTSSIDVPYSKVPDAWKAGYRMHPEYISKFVNDAAADPKLKKLSPAPGVKVTGLNSAGQPILAPEEPRANWSVGHAISTAGSVLYDTASGLYHAVKEGPQNPEEEKWDKRGLLTTYRLVIAPMMQQTTAAAHDLNAAINEKGPQRTSDIESGLSHAGATVIPGVGPWANQVGEQVGTKIGEKDYAGAAGVVGGNAALYVAPHVIGRVGELAAKTPRLARAGVEALTDTGPSQVAELADETLKENTAQINKHQEKAQNWIVDATETDKRVQDRLDARNEEARKKVDAANIKQLEEEGKARLDALEKNKENIKNYQDEVRKTKEENNQKLQAEKNRQKVTSDYKSASVRLRNKYISAFKKATTDYNDTWNKWRSMVKGVKAPMKSVVDTIQAQEKTLGPDKVGIFNQIMDESGADEIAKQAQKSAKSSAQPTAAQPSLANVVSQGLTDIDAERLHTWKSQLERAVRSTSDGSVRYAIGKVLDSVRDLETQVSSKVPGAAKQLSVARKLTGPYFEAFFKSPEEMPRALAQSLREQTPGDVKTKAQDDRLERIATYDPSIKTLATHIDNLEEALKKAPKPFDMRHGFTQLPEKPTPVKSPKSEPTKEFVPKTRKPIDLSNPPRTKVPDRPVDAQADLPAHKAQNVLAAAKLAKNLGIRKVLYTVSSSLSIAGGVLAFSHSLPTAFESLASIPIILGGTHLMGELIANPEVVAWLSKITPKDVAAWEKLTPEQKAVFKDDMSKLVKEAENKKVKVSPAMKAFVSGSAASQKKKENGNKDNTPGPQSMNLQGVSGLIEQAKQHKPTGGIEKIVDIPGVQSSPVQQQASIKITHRFNPQSGEIEAA